MTNVIRIGNDNVVDAIARWHNELNAKGHDELNAKGHDDAAVTSGFDNRKAMYVCMLFYKDSLILII